MSGLTVEKPFHIQSGRTGHRKINDGEAVPQLPPGRIPRISRLMALAIRFDRLIRDGVVADQAELARLGHVTRARMTQIMSLLQLAPDIQETLLFLPVTKAGRDKILLREVLPIAAIMEWGKQRTAWRAFIQ